MTSALELLPASPSLLTRLDPRWKLGGILVLVVAVVLLQALPTAGVAFLLALLLVAIARLPARWLTARLAAAGVFLLLLVVWLPFTLDGPGIVWRFGPLRLSEYGMRMAALLCAKALAILLLIVVLLTTAPLDATLKAAHALRVPSLFLQLLSLAYRYLFLLGGELARLRIALRVRGYRNRANRHSYETIGHVAGSLLVRSYERAERVGQAMRCRGFDGRFWTLNEFHTRVPDVIAFVFLLTSAAGLVLGDWLLR
jgi:cobalt/nickel transport system permease protein